MLLINHSFRGGLTERPYAAELEPCHRRYHLAADHLQRSDPLHVRDRTVHRLDAHACEPLQLPNQLFHFGPILANIEEEWAGLFDGVVITALCLAMPAQHVQLLRDLRTRLYIAGVCVACNQAQGFLLAATGDHDRRVWPLRPVWQLRRIERSFDVELLAVVGSISPVLAAPQLQADLHRLLQHLEAFRDRRERDPQALRFIRVVTRADAEPGASAGEHVQRRDYLGEHRRVPEMWRGCKRDEFDTLCAGCQKGKRRVAFRNLPLLRAHPGWNRPQVIGHGDATETVLVCGPGDLCERGAEVRRAAVPDVVVELQRKFHTMLPHFQERSTLGSSCHPFCYTDHREELQAQIADLGQNTMQSGLVLDWTGDEGLVVPHGRQRQPLKPATP